MTQEEFFKRYTYSPSRDRIGGGGFGTVYKAYDNVLHREVAIKVSEVKTTADGKKTFSLKDEFEALNHVPKHPNIANYEEFYSYEMPNGIFDYAVMQYYPDGNLSNAIKQGLTAEQKEDIATQLLEGIDFLHQHKVVHRDLKPGNILIVKHSGRIIPLITDFGLSKAAGVVDGSVFSNSFGAGTPRYSSPEQLQGNPLRLNTDLWSYGAILYELFTGEQLFSVGSGAANTAQVDMEIYNKIVNGNVQNLGQMPEKWRKVAERCLVVDAGKRAKDAGKLFGIINGDVADDDETEVGTVESPLSPFGKGGARSGEGAWQGKPSRRDDTLVTAGRDMRQQPTDEPKSKKALWIGLGIAAAVFAAVLLLRKPKAEPAPADPDTQAYEACQTVADYRAYMSDYGRNALHYADAKAFIDQYLADSAAKAQQALAEAQAQQQAEAEAKAQAEAEKKEEAAYKKCTNIAGCNAYLKKYPEGKYVAKVKANLEKFEKENEEEVKESVSFRHVSSAPQGGVPNFTFFFSKDKYSLSDKAINKNVSKAIQQMDYEKTKGFRLVAYAVPGESETIAKNRVNAVEKELKVLLSNSKVNKTFDLQSLSMGTDWQKIVHEISFSSNEDKDAIVYTLQNASDKNQAWANMCAMYPFIEREILPLLRKVDVYVY